MKTSEKMRVKALCIGYPECDGDLVGEPHEERCPLHGTFGPPRIEAAFKYADEVATIEDSLAAREKEIAQLKAQREALEDAHGKLYWWAVEFGHRAGCGAYLNNECTCGLNEACEMWRAATTETKVE